MKKIISFMLSVSVMLSMVTASISASAATSVEDGVIALVNELAIMQGDENGDMGLEREVSRAEFAKIAVAASSAKNSVAIGLKISPYRDVPYSTWYAPYIKAAVSAGFVQGYLDSTYRPENTVTYEEAVTIMLRVLGYTDSDFGDAYPYGQLAKAQGLEMLDDVDGQMGENMTRRQVMYLVYNTLQASAASSSGSASSSSGAASGSASSAGATSGGTAISSLTSTTSTSSAPSFSGQLLSVHDCTMTEDVNIIATSAQDSSLGSDKVFTSAGTFTKGSRFSDSNVGTTGTIFVKNSKDIIAFVPDEAYSAEDYEEYFVYSILANTVVGYEDGKFTTIDIPDSTTVYQNQSPTTYAALKSNMEMGDTLFVKRTSGGSIDYITYESSTLTGPVKITSDSWMSEIGASSSATIMRDGERTTQSAIMTNDIVYYSAPINMVFAYSNKITGIYESASPTKDSPLTVKISGTEYEVEGIDAFNNLSSSGSFAYGDTVTICLGKDGKAAGVVTSETVSNSSTGSVTGYVTEAGTKTFTDSNGKEFSSYYITVVTAAGAEGTYRTTTNRSSLVGIVVTAQIDDGEVTKVGRQNSTGIDGTVSYTDRTIGDYTLAANVNVLDVSNDNVYDTVLYKKIFVQRIDGIKLSSSQILYYEENSMGQITDLILNNVTGDTYTYGVINKADGGTYEINIDGSVGTYATGLAKEYYGPVKLIMDGNSVKGVLELGKYSGEVSELTSTTAKCGNTTYRLSDTVVCYKKTQTTKYQKITLDEAMSGKYTINAYYDKTEASGGRIRILVCNAD